MWLRSLVIAVSFAMAAIAQSADVDSLASFDWRERNRAAKVLADAAELPVEQLLELLATPWRGPELLVGRFGGSPRSSSPLDPWERVHAAATRELVVATSRIVAPEPASVVANAADLVVPWHPHQLAAWLLSSRRSAQAEIATALQGRRLTNPELARLWVASANPTVAAVLARDWRGSDLSAVVHALWFAAAGGPELLAKVLVGGRAELRRAVVGLGDAAVLVDDAAIDAVIDVFLGDESDRGRAGWLLTRSGVATARLRARIGDDEATNRAVLGLLCVMADQVGEVGGELLPFVTGRDRLAQQRALAVLARARVPRAAGAALVAPLLALVEAKRGSKLGLLAVDALGGLGDTIDGDTRARLVALLEEQDSAGARPRLLGCLHRLGAVPPMAAARKLEICTMRLPNLRTWLAAVDDPGVAAAALRTQLVEPRAQPVRIACAERLCERDPDQIVAWLDDGDAALRRAAIEVLQRRPSALVAASRIADLLADPERDVVTDALAWLAKREEAAEYTADGLSAIARSFEQWVPREAGQFVRRVSPTLPQLTAALAPLFARGVGLELLDGCDAAEVGGACRAWLAATGDAGVRQQLLGCLVRRGVFDDEVVGMVDAVVREESCASLLRALGEAPTLPPPLALALERHIDVAFAALPAGGFDELAGSVAREALLLQTRRRAPR